MVGWGVGRGEGRTWSLAFLIFLFDLIFLPDHVDSSLLVGLFVRVGLTLRASLSGTFLQVLGV